MSKSKNKFFILLLTLLSVIIIAPFFMRQTVSAISLTIIITAVLLSSVYAIRKSKTHLWIALGLALLNLITHTLALSDTQLTTIFSTITSMLFLAFITYVILNEILAGQRITPEKIYGALCVYILVGIMFGQFYGLIEFIHPDSFIMNNVVTATNDYIIRMQLITFSFSILTTVGHSTIVPINLFAHSIIILEELAGVLYLATLVARLVTGFTLQARRT